MSRFSDFLTEKYLFSYVQIAVDAIVETRFKDVFDRNCLKEIKLNTTLGATFAELQESVIETLNKRFKEQREGINVFACGNINNPFLDIIYDLYEEFVEGLDVEPYVSELMGEHFHHMQEKLFKLGVVDCHGDFIKKNDQ